MAATDDEGVQSYLENIGIEYRFGCYKEKNPESCYSLGLYFDTIIGDLKKAGKVFERNCNENSHGQSCFKYGVMRLKGEGSEKNVLDSRQYFEKACHLDNTKGCAVAGEMFNKGTNEGDKNGYKLMPDMDKATAFLEKACNKNDSQSCFALAAIFIQGSGKYITDMERAFNLSVKGCELNNLYACANTALMYKNGDGVARDLEKYNTYSDRAKHLQNIKNMKTKQFNEFKKNI